MNNKGILTSDESPMAVLMNTSAFKDMFYEFSIILYISYSISFGCILTFT